MPVSGTGEREAIFVRIPKTASTSVEAILRSHRHVLMNSRDRMLRGGFDQWMEDGLANVWRRALGTERWRAAYKFCFVRNPYDRAVSSWKHACRLLARGKRITAAPGFADEARLLVDRVLYKVAARNAFGLSVSFRDFLDLLEAGRLCGHARWHAAAQSLHVVDEAGRVDVDFLGRFENLDDDFAEVCRVVGIPRAQLPRLNPSERDAYERYYDEGTRELVRRLYRRDFELLDYPE